MRGSGARLASTWREPEDDEVESTTDVVDAAADGGTGILRGHRRGRGLHGVQGDACTEANEYTTGLCADDSTCDRSCDACQSCGEWVQEVTCVDAPLGPEPAVEGDGSDVRDGRSRCATKRNTSWAMCSRERSVLERPAARRAGGGFFSNGATGTLDEMNSRSSHDDRRAVPSLPLEPEGPRFTRASRWSRMERWRAVFDRGLRPIRLASHRDVDDVGERWRHVAAHRHDLSCSGDK